MAMLQFRRLAALGAKAGAAAAAAGGAGAAVYYSNNPGFQRE